MSNDPGLTAMARPKKSSLSPKNSSSNLAAAGAVGGGGGMRRNKISFGAAETLLFEKEIQDEEHVNEIWYSKKEMKTIRKDLKTCIKKGDISRGLEQYEGDMGAETKQKRLNHMYSILDLQDEQKSKGVYDEKGFYILSRSMSSGDIGKARLLASMDSTQALEEYKNLTAKNQSNMIRTSSKTALDNFRKSMADQNKASRTSKSMGRLNFANFSGSNNNIFSGIGGNEGGSNKNATFGGMYNKKKAPNMLLAVLANKQRQTPQNPNIVPGQAGVA